jgi:hypothetical protein
VAKASAIEAKADVEVQAAPAVAPAEAPFLVKAIATGTYPNPGEIVARWREVGDVFLCKSQKDMGRWMKRLTDAEAKDAEPTGKTIPQTTGKPRKPYSPLS